MPAISESEKPFKLPKSWEWCRLGDLISISSGDGLTKENMQNGKVPVFGGNGINGYHNEYNTNKTTVTIGRVGAYCGAVHLTPKLAWITDNCFRVYFSEKNIGRDYLVIYLRAINLGENAFKGAQPVISSKRLYPLAVYLPPLAEQNAIADKVQKIIKICDELEQENQQNQERTKLLIQTLLSETFTPKTE